MKTLFLFLCLLPIGLKAQTELSSGDMDTTFYLDAMVSYHHSLSDYYTINDTIPVIMLVSDTSALCEEVFVRDTTNVGSLYYAGHYEKRYSKIYINHTYWLRGYAIANLHSLRLYGHETISLSDNVKYLGPDKKPITYLVWDSRRVK